MIWQDNESAALAVPECAGNIDLVYLWIAAFCHCLSSDFSEALYLLANIRMYA